MACKFGFEVQARYFLVEFFLLFINFLNWRAR